MELSTGLSMKLSGGFSKTKVFLARLSNEVCAHCTYELELEKELRDS